MKPFCKGKNLHSYFCAFHWGGRERKRQSEREREQGEKKRMRKKEQQ